jgi:hypothetical protein
MTATAAQIAEVRRMIAEPTTTTYTDVLIQGFIERYPLVDDLGQEPYYYSGGTPPEKTVNESWVPTYDLCAAAADIWGEKAAALAGDYAFSADGATFNRNQAFEQYTKRERYYRSRRSARTITQHMSPDPHPGLVGSL